MINKTHTDYTLFTYLDKIMCFSQFCSKNIYCRNKVKEMSFTSVLPHHTN